MFTQILRLLSLVGLLLICAACDLEVIPDNFTGGPIIGDITTFDNVDNTRGAVTGLAELSDGSLLMTGSTGGEVYIRRTDPEGNLTLDRTYMENGTEVASDIVQLSDGTYVVVGSSVDPVSTQTNALYLRTNTSGDPLVGPLSITLPDAYEHLFRVLELADGSVLMVGYTISGVTGNIDLYLLRYSPDLATRFFQRVITLPDREIPSDAIVVPDGFIVVGTSTPGGGTALPRAMLARFDLDGNLAAGHPRLSEGGNGRQYSSIERVGDNDFFVVGQTVLNGDTDILLARLDADGTHTAGYPKIFGNGAEEFILDASATTDGGIILCGQEADDALLLKVDASGTEDWRIANPLNGIDGYNRVIATLDGGYAIGGFRGGSSYYAKTNDRGRVE